VSIPPRFRLLICDSMESFGPSDLSDVHSIAHTERGSLRSNQ